MKTSKKDAYKILNILGIHEDQRVRLALAVDPHPVNNHKNDSSFLQAACINKDRLHHFQHGGLEYRGDGASIHVTETNELTDCAKEVWKAEHINDCINDSSNLIPYQDHHPGGVKIIDLQLYGFYILFRFEGLYFNYRRIAAAGKDMKWALHTPSGRLVGRSNTRKRFAVISHYGP